MGRRASSGPTESELEILQVLWGLGRATVRQVNDSLNRTRPTGYTTTLKLLQIMLDKKRVKRDESRWPHVYRATVSQETTQRRLVDELLDRAFNGSARKLVLQALQTTDIPQEEIQRVGELLDELERGSDESE